jgi:hypothetical protein
MPVDRDTIVAPQSNSAHEVGSVPVTFEKALQDWELEMEHVFEANRAAEQLGAEDLAIRINAKA